mgnify:CR=1 FL=1
MKDFSVPFGRHQISFGLPEKFTIDTLMPQTGQPLDNPEEAIRHALNHPIGNLKNWSEVEVGTIGIAINDKTRPVPNPNPLTILLDHFDQLGFQKSQITLFIGSGSHKPMNRSELKRLMPAELIGEYRIIAHDCDESPLVDLGRTPHGTPILINADFVACDLKLTLGNIEPHHFMGYSGGVKTAVIGLAGRETINTNHAMLTHPQARSGLYHINPMRQDLEIIGRRAGIDFSLGTVLDENKQILKVFYGEPAAVMKAAIPPVVDYFGVPVAKPYHLVIASPGGYPKDLNLYQAQKALTQASRITRKNGWLILLAACPEGSGSAAYEDYIKTVDSHQAVINHFEIGYFEVGPHKAYQIAREALRVNLVLVSEIPPRTVKRWKLTPSTPQLLQPLIDWIAARLPEDARVAVLPAATRTMTEIINE